MFNKTPLAFVPPGYQADLDRLPATGGNSCARLLGLIFGGFFVCGVVMVGIGFLINQSRQPAPVEAQPLTLVPYNAGAAPIVATLDPWSVTGTALYLATITPTIDYCWFLTPSPTPSLTPLPITPDAWALQGTAIALSTGTATFTPTATQTTPKAWCDIAPTGTFTPYPIEVVPTETALPSNTPTVTPRPTETALPSLLLATDRPAPVYQAPTAAPVVQAPPLVQPPQVIYATVIVIATQPPTIAPTSTPTASPTLTPTATGTPSFLVVSDCNLGYPSFVATVTGIPGDWLQWTITDATNGIVNSGVWNPGDITQAAAPIATAGGLFNLNIYQFWDNQILTTPVTCLAPTATASPTLTDLPTATETPTETATP